MIDGRGFGVVMAFSFCCAPLHAIRYKRNGHKVPDMPEP
jgi:hypothetical protein